MNTSDYSGQIDLLALPGAALETVDGRQCIVIPKDMNPAIYLFRTRNGEDRAYLDVVVKESPSSQYGNTHFVRASVGRSNRERLGITKEELPKFTPIIGNLKPFEVAKPAPTAQTDDIGDLPEGDFQGF